MADADGEDGWEDSYLLMELDGVIDNDWINKSGDKWKIIGVETTAPLLQMNRYVFTGEYEDTVGTDIIFEVTNNQEREADRASAEKPLGGQPIKHTVSYSCHVFKRLQMKRTFLAEKEERQTAASFAQNLVTIDGKTRLEHAETSEKCDPLSDVTSAPRDVTPAPQESTSIESTDMDTSQTSAQSKSPQATGSKPQTSTLTANESSTGKNT